MKVIDLLNKIANGEIKLGTKFNWHYKMYDIELIFTKRQGALGLYFQREDRWIGLFERFNYQILNDEVEILEEEKKIPEKISIKKEHYNEYIEDYCFKNIPLENLILNQNEVVIIDKIDEIIDYLHYLKSKGDE